MKRISIIFALLLCASLLAAQDLQVSATGTGQTTGSVANLSVYNPGSQNQDFTLSPGFIPATGRFQPYIVSTPVSVTVPAGSTVNVLLDGYCADIFSEPVPSGVAMPPVNSWTSAGDIPANWMPLPAKGWKPNEGSRVLHPVSGEPLGYSIDLHKYPAEAAPLLLDALRRIEQAYDELQQAGSIHTPFSGNPEKEYQSVIQQTFWMYAAELTGRPYKQTDFEQKTIEQYESVSGQKFSKAPPAVQENVLQGATDFWTTFEAVGTQAKIMAPESSGGNAPELISVKDQNCECGSVTLSVKVGTETIKLDGGVSARASASKTKVASGDNMILEISNLVTNCTECKTGICKPENVKVVVSTEGMTNNVDETLEYKKEKYTTGKRTVETLEIEKEIKKLKDDKEKVPQEKEAQLKRDKAANPIRWFITVSYDCASKGCRPAACEKVFEVTVPRK